MQAGYVANNVIDRIRQKGNSTNTTNINIYSYYFMGSCTSKVLLDTSLKLDMLLIFKKIVSLKKMVFLRNFFLIKKV
jgi:hypothetical protein